MPGPRKTSAKATTDPQLVERVRVVLNGTRSVVEKKLFGGVAWLLNGNVCVGVWQRWLIARLGGDDVAALRDPNVRPFDITGKPMRGWVKVEPAGCATDDELRDWVQQCVAFVRTLPVK
ncbi:TfoX/Sxy family protein [Gemmata sp. JC717]|uniref:TfoX/Sxy family protein n=1 Tax=Gemmata algarum TaxID=2975278 RepID=UPI0021BB6D86|nr:TfoX/Sxy family protein [Gemmata algarum]MDY3555672.1 TfoX/Sxy family protein [Gemmata algarum]